MARHSKKAEETGAQSVIGAGRNLLSGFIIASQKKT